MPSTIVVGGQYGAEGKGKVTALIAHSFESPWVVRCGGPNSGHTVTFNGENLILRQVPACPDHPTATLLLAAGCVVDENLLINELDILGIPPNRIIVDPRAVLLSEQDRINERDSIGYISSTFSGTGSALIRRISRRKDIKLVKDSTLLQKRCTVRTIAPMLHEVLDKSGNVVIEGTQGFALSLLHSPHYPYVTSRDTTAAGFAMEVGLSPRQIDRIVMVIRTFPIRVGGESGPLPNEITWKEVQRISDAPGELPELTSVTRKLRRVAKFDIESIKMACRYNSPNALAVMGLDRLEYANHGVLEWTLITQQAKDFVASLEKETGVPVLYVGTGFYTSEAIAIPRSTLKKEFLYV
jgi:adenylosuccinate synthase